MLSEFEYVSPGSRFGAYWTLQLSDAVTPGLWALEAVVDGVPAGMHAFQILANADANLTQASRPQLTPGQVYTRIQTATATVDRLDVSGQKVASASGFLVPGGRLLTTFAIVDGAARIRASLADGKTAELDRLIAWDRRGDWALFEHAFDTEPIALAPEGAGEIGDRCYSLDVPLEGSRVLAEGQVVGLQTFPEVGERLSVNFPLTTQAYGSPVVNPYGEAIGLAVSPGTWPGWTRTTFRFAASIPAPESAVLMVTPLKRVDVGSKAVPVALSTLMAKGEFMQPLVESEHIGQALLLREIDEERIETGITPLAGEFEFSRAVGKVIVFVYWNPLAEIQSDYWLELFDLDNRRVFRGETQHLKLKAYTRSHTWWTLQIGSLPPAVYRTDLVMGGQAVWRGFFKVTE